MQIFEFAIIHKPQGKKDGENPKAEIIIPVTQILAKDANQAQMLAARAIPEKYVDRLDRLEVAVRPF